MTKGFIREDKSHFYSIGINPIFAFMAVAMLILSIFRVAIIFYVDESDVYNNLTYVLLQGIRVDLATTAPLFGVIALVLLLLQVLGTIPRILLFFIKLSLSLGMVFLVMNEAATFGFIKEYGIRPNHIYVDYLIYPKELIKTLVYGHTLELALSILAMVLSFYLSFKLATFLFGGYRTLKSFKVGIVLLLIVIVLAPMAVRSTLGHRPLNPSMVSFSSSPLANTIPLNSSYSAVYAATHRDPELSLSSIYGFATYDEIKSALDKFSPSRIKDSSLKPVQCVFNQKLVATNTSKKKNVVVVLEESFGANFIGSLGGLPLSPNYDRIAKDGWSFSNMYASGHRSIRGIEAVTSGFPSSPQPSVVKLNETQQNLTTFMNVFKSLGFSTSFIYGGESHFDNMNNYFRGNGADLVIDERDYDNPSFVASWGVSDEDLFNRANSVYKDEYAKGNNFFSLIFTSSFHDPFEIPEGKVKLPEGLETDEKDRLLAVSYADYALGKFIDTAKSEDYYKDTIFLIIADHESRVRGAQIFPMYDFKIPAVILGDGIASRVDNRVVSQVNMLPTVLSLAGVEGIVPFIGENLNVENTSNMAPMVFDNIFALRVKDKLVVLAPAQEAKYYKLDDKNEVLTEIAPNKDLHDLALGILNLPIYMYEHKTALMDCTKVK